jgi:predicted PurR-regulated permease PerM
MPRFSRSSELFSKHQPFYTAACIRLLLLGLVITFLVIAKELLIPLTISVFLTFILEPVSARLERLHFPRWLAILISIVLAFALLFALLWFLYLQLQSFSDDMGQLKTALAAKADSIQQFIREYFNVSKRAQSRWLDKKISSTMDEGDQFLLTLFTVTGTFLTNLALIPLYVFFLSLYRPKIKKFISLISNGENEHTLTIMHSISGVAQKYLKGLMIDVLIVAVMCSASFLLFGVKHAILFGIVVAACNIIIPYMGVTFASILPLCMMLITNDQLSYAVGIVGICILIQFIDNHFINPYIVGSSVSINPLAAFIALVASAMIWGIFGMLLCIPVTGMIKVVCDNVTSLKPYGYILGLESHYHRNGKNEKVLKIIAEKKNA